MTITTVVAQRYQIEDKIGQGGMGTVYRAYDLESKQLVAIKHLKRDLMGDDADTLERFRREAALLRELNHPNIVHLQDIVEADTEYYLVLEYVPGGSLSEVLHRETYLPVTRTLQIGLDLADALTRAHRLGVIHRDIKPSNVLIAADGTPRLSDFGIAHSTNADELTRPGTLLGTAAYLSPEAFRSEAVNERSDIWSFGVLLYQMLTGRLPFDNRQPLPSLISSILHDPLPDITTLRPDVPNGVVELLSQLLEKDPNKRVNSVRQVGAALENLLAGTPVTPIRLSQTMPAVQTDTYDGHTPPTLRLTNSTGSLSLVRNAPSNLGPFVGRVRDVEDIVTVIRAGDVRLMTIVGSGGIGKSRLGLRVTQQLAPDYPGGAFFVPLAMVSESDFVLQAIADAMDFNFVTNEPQVRQLSAYLREKQLIILLDNFEHVADAAMELSAILSAAPGVVMVVTSRERLNLQEEWVHAVDGLAVPQDTTSDTEIANAEAVQLFAELARRNQSEFDVNANLPNILRILRLVEGSPLAIQLATAWLTVLPLDAIADEIEENFDFLESRMRNVPERHRSLRAVFEYSWNTLAEQERNTLRDLTVFMAGFTRDAAKVVVGTSLRTITSLVDKSLVNVGKHGTYWLHSMVRTYARQHLEAASDRHTVLEKRLVGYYTTILRQHFYAESTNRDEERRVLLESWGNIREAWQLAIKHQLMDAMDEMTFPIWYLLETRNLADEGIKAFQPACDKLPITSLMNTKLNLVLAWFMMRSGDLDGAYTLAVTQMALVAELDEPIIKGFAHNVIAYILYRRGDFAQALTFAQVAVDAFEGTQMWWGKGLALGNIGYIQLMRGDYADARKHLERALDLAAHSGFSFAAGYAANNLGEVILKQGNAKRAEKLFEQALDAFQKIDYQPGLAFVLGNLGDVARIEGNFTAEAYDRYNQGIKIYEDLGDQSGLAALLVKRGQFALAAGAYEEAHYQLEHGLVIYRNNGQPSGMALALYLLGETAYILDDLVQAERYFFEALGVASDSDSQRQQLQALLGLGSLAAENGQYAKAVRILTLIADHEASEYDTRQRATRTITALEERMSATDFKAAVTEGHRTTIVHEVSRLFSELDA